MIENIADFISAYIIGNLLQMAFRFWAFRRWVFPDEFGRDPEKALESTLTGGGIAEAMEDGYEARHPHSGDDGGQDNVTPMRLSRKRAPPISWATLQNPECRRLRDPAGADRCGYHGSGIA